jgi:predicted nucleotidyltransferase
MSASSRTLQTNPKLPIDPTTLQILQTIENTLGSGQISHMLVGATARDLLLHHTYGLNITRATYDLDFAILVESWERFEEAKQLLLGVPGFEDRKREVQRLYYTSSPGATFETKIDIIPFGQLETPDGKIRWPREADTVMNVAAFSDVFKSSLLIQVEPHFTIPIASLAGLAILKLFAWLDRRDDRDVTDLLRLFETYADAGNFERLFDEAEEELQRVGYDTTLAGSFLLGKDAHRLTEQSTRNQLSESLTVDERSRLLATMIRRRGTFEDHTEAVTVLFDSFFRGLQLPTVSTR